MTRKPTPPGRPLTPAEDQLVRHSLDWHATAGLNPAGCIDCQRLIMRVARERAREVKGG